MPADLGEIRRGALGLLRPPARRRLSEYIEDTIHLPSGLSSVPGPISLWRNFQSQLCDALIEHERCTVLKGARLGWTTLLAGVVGHFIQNDPASILLVNPTAEDARNAVIALESVFAVSPALRDAMPIARTGPNNNFDTMHYRRFAGGSFRSVAARSPRALRSHAARILIVDEASACEITVEGNPIVLAEQRTRTFPDRHILIGGTPLNSTTCIVYNSYLNSDQRIYIVPCPSCNAEHEIMWADIKWPEGKPEQAAWCCPTCGVYHDETYKRDMVENGRWLITKPEVKNHAGFRLNCLIAPHVNSAWSRLAEEFLIAKKRPETLKPFVQLILGQPWNDEDEDNVQPHELQALAQPISLDAIPAEVLYLCSGVDVQTGGGGRLEVSTWGFTEDDATWFALDHRQFFGDPLAHEVWAELAEFLAQRFPHPLAGAPLGIDAACIDAGDGHVLDKVLSFCSGHRALRAIPIKGASGSRPALAPTASKRTKGLQICGVDGLKTRLFDRLTRRAGIAFSDALPLAYFEQLTSERPVIRYTRGRPVRIWERYSGRIAAEALDTATYCLAARSAVAISPARRVAELSSRVALAPPMPSVIRSAWLTGQPAR